MKKPYPSAASLNDGIRFICSDAKGRAVIQWLLNKECDVEMPMSASTFEHDESRRELGRKIRELIATNFNRSYIVELEEEKHG